MTPTSTRERIARIIEPEGWAVKDSLDDHARHGAIHEDDGRLFDPGLKRVEASLAKADEILSGAPFVEEKGLSDRASNDAVSESPPREGAFERPDATVHLQWREDGGLRVWSDTHPGLILSGKNGAELAGAIFPALRVLDAHQRGEDWRVIAALLSSGSEATTASPDSGGTSSDDVSDRDGIDAGFKSPPREGWATIDSAPKDGTCVDLWAKGHGRVVDLCWRPIHRHAGVEGWTNDWYGRGQLYADQQFTHWRPRPLTPTDGM